MQLALKFRNMLPEIVRQELDSLVAMIGTFFAVEHNPDGTHSVVHERGRAVAMGEWIDVSYDPTNFTTNSAAAWTVEGSDQITLCYTLVGKTMTLAYHISASSLTAPAPTELRIALPDGVVSVSLIRNSAHIFDTGWATGVGIAKAGATYLGIQKVDSATWTAGSVNNIYVTGEISFRIQ